MAILILLFFIILNGLFALMETAMVAVRKVRLEQAAAEGDAGARAALELAESPTRLLSTTQIVITLISILSGAYAEAALADDLAGWLGGSAVLRPYSRVLATVINVLAISYFSLVLGELVPKRLALNNPERMAARFARPMGWLASAAGPVVSLLTRSTDLVLGVFGAASPPDDAVSEDEIRGLIQKGAESGVFHVKEHELVERVFRLGDQTVAALMVRRSEIDWLEESYSAARIRVAVATSPHSHFPVCRGGLENLIGVVHVKDLVKGGLLSQTIDLKSVIRPPQFVPETMPALHVLEEFKAKRAHIAFVLDEYGVLEGLVTLNDVVSAVLGEISRQGDEAEPMIVQRADGSWLLDGMLPIHDLMEVLETDTLPKQEETGYQTMSGLVMASLGRIPATGDVFDWDRFRFEVVDMDRQRVDKVLVSQRPPPIEHGDEPVADGSSI